MHYVHSVYIVHSDFFADILLLIAHLGIMILSVLTLSLKYSIISILLDSIFSSPLFRVHSSLSNILYCHDNYNSFLASYIIEVLETIWLLLFSTCKYYSYHHSMLSNSSSMLLIVGLFLYKNLLVIISNDQVLIR